jgi:hypothetical protein
MKVLSRWSSDNNNNKKNERRLSQMNLIWFLFIIQARENSLK